MPALQKRARFIVLTAIALMVLVIVPTFNDSTNIPKYSILFFAAAFGASVLSIPKFGLLEKKNWKSWAPPLLFLTIMLIMASSCDLNPAGSSGKLSGAAVAQRQHRHPQDAASFEEASLSLSSDLAAPK